MKKMVSSIAASAILLGGILPVVDSAYAKDKLSEKKMTMTFDVISDIQGDLRDFGHVLQDINKENPKSKALIINGDITPRGYDFEYQAVQDVLDKNPHPENVWYSIGNHEFYVPKWKNPQTLAQSSWPNGTTEEELFDNFYQFSGEDKVYHQKEINGYPLLFLGTEKYMKYHDPKLWDEVYMSDEQLDWLKENLEHYSKQDKNKPIFVFSHHVLPDSVSGSRQNPYLNDYLNVDKLLDILKDYPQVVFFTSHTHWDLNLPDWAGKKKVEGGDKRGFTVVNTGGIETGWMSAGPDGGEKVAPDGGAFKQGLRLQVYGDDVVIQAYDYQHDKVIKELGIHNGKIEQLAPDVQADDENNVLVGATRYMEYAVGNQKNWQDFDPENLPAFPGNQVVFVRHKGEMNLEDGTPIMVKFKK
ncbi:DUF4073 domain-containing protein [uncultured Brevibacillus sp.]|uniref:DUF4073 domain-containing protein n=1 Tax=uncultured Brevibacillus sp. TaxID=169970 RepID=UPI00259A200D|nr:DUF4073 domain-containing protein [uncultured Brevibacillus sp.]